ncbi:MAG: synthase family protein, partial [Thermoproteota archaeon]|nr:synthase family protein [Thermoproteota archaeon]
MSRGKVGELEVSEIGKFSLDLIEKIVYTRLGAGDPSVLVGPGHGKDNCIIKVGGGQVLVATADPLSIIPMLGLKNSAYISVHLLASDLATCGFPPRFFMVNLNLPPQMKDEEFEEYWTQIDIECKKLNVAIVGGHTGRYVGSDYTVVGGGVMMALAPEDKYLSSNMARPGDQIIMTKGTAIAATALLSLAFPQKIEKTYGSNFLEQAQQYIHKFSVVEDALTAASVGLREEGVTSMHDVTEGGLFGALYELTKSANIGLEISLQDVVVTEEAKLICQLFSLPLYSTLSEGPLIITSKPEKTPK